MQLKAVRSITVSSLFLQVGGEVDDLNGLVRALLHAESAADAELLGDLRDRVGGCHLDAKLSLHVDRAAFLAFEVALLRPASVDAHHGDTRELVLFIILLRLGRHGALNSTLAR